MTSNQQELADKLKGIIPPFSIPTNPVDLIWPPMANRAELFLECWRTMLKETDAMLVESNKTTGLGSKPSLPADYTFPFVTSAIARSRSV